jgi:hypothetical protein
MESTDVASATTTFWEVTAEQLRSWPRWDAAKEPPLAVSAAVEKAFQALPEGEKKADWQFNSITIQQPMEDDVRKTYGPVFFYFVSLSRRSDSWSTWDCLINFGGGIIPSKKEKIPMEKENTIIITPKVGTKPNNVSR